MKVFISQKFRDLSEQEVIRRRKMIISLMKKDFDRIKFEIIENWHPDFDKNSVGQLGKSIVEMSEADLVLISETSTRNVYLFHKIGTANFIKGSEFELLTCRSYGIPYKKYRFKFEEKNNPLSKALSVEWVF